MAQRRLSEVLAGAAVLAAAIGFLVFAVTTSGRPVGGGYVLHASFDRIDGLEPGSDVRMAGVKIGSVESTHIDPKTFQAEVTFSVARDIALPTDSSAEVSSSGLLGGVSLLLTPGGEQATIPPGGTVTITQSAVSLEELLGKFIFNVGELSTAVQKSLHQGPMSGQGPGAAPKSGGAVVPPLQ